jgi:ankyrin repeat protein
VLLPQVLLQGGASVDVKDDDGCTPLSLAAGSGHLGVIRALLLAGASLATPADDGRTPVGGEQEVGLRKFHDFCCLS